MAKDYKMIYIAAAVIILAVIIGIAIFKLKGPSVAGSAAEFPWQIGNFEPSWRYFMGFDCEKNPALSIQANTFKALTGIILPDSKEYLSCWYKVGEGYTTSDVTEDSIGEKIGAFNPKSAYDVTLCCKLIDENGEDASDKGCNTIHLDKFC